MEVDSEPPPEPEVPTLDYATPIVPPRLRDVPGGTFGFLIAVLVLLTEVVAGSIVIAKSGSLQFELEIMPAAPIYAILGSIVGFFAGIAAKNACITRLMKSSRRLIPRRWGSLIAASVYLALAIPGCVLYLNYFDEMSYKMAELCFVLLAAWLMLFPLNADRILLREAEKPM